MNEQFLYTVIVKFVNPKTNFSKVISGTVVTVRRNRAIALFLEGPLVKPLLENGYTASEVECEIVPDEILLNVLLSKGYTLIKGNK